MDDPISICKKLCESRKDDPKKLYQYLIQFGMYQPNQKSQRIFKSLQENDTWKKINTIFKNYKKKWDGPDVPIYIFPIGNENRKKSGVSFPDKLFIFLSNIKDEKEMEALFIHEYHHVCRMSRQKKTIDEYTLLDSLIIEGLAEDAVCKHLGKEYLAKWSRSIPEADFQKYWEKYLKNNLTLNKADKLHDQLLFGKGFLPNMLGYTCGYHLVNNYRQKNNFSTLDSFVLESKKFIDENLMKA